MTDQIAVDHRGVVGPLAHLAAGGVGVGLPAVVGDGVVVDHGVHVAAGDQKAQTGLAVDVDGSGLAPVGLGDDAHLITGLLQDPGDDGVAEGMVIDVGVADDIDEIALFPAAIDHVLSAKGEKFHNEPPIGYRYNHYSRFRRKRKDGRKMKKSEIGC